MIPYKREWLKYNFITLRGYNKVCSKHFFEKGYMSYMLDIYEKNYEYFVLIYEGGYAYAEEVSGPFLYKTFISNIDHTIMKLSEICDIAITEYIRYKHSKKSNSVIWDRGDIDLDEQSKM